MMSLEDRLQDNLKAAGDALVVPEPRRQPAVTRPRPWRRPVGVLVTAALATLVLIALPLILADPANQGSDPSTPVGTPNPTPGTVPPTTTTPPTTTAPTSTTQAESMPALADISTGSAQYLLFAERGADENMPTASVTIRATSIDGLSQIDEVHVGEPDSFFYNSVTGPGGVCSFYASGSEPDRIVVQMLLSPSVGCSQPFVFELRDDSLIEVDPSAQEISQLFVTAWQSGDEATMASMASPDAVDLALGITEALTDPTLVSCGAAAGSLYCTYDDADETIVVQVQNVELPPTVVGVSREG